MFIDCFSPLSCLCSEKSTICPHSRFRGTNHRSLLGLQVSTAALNLLVQVTTVRYAFHGDLHLNFAEQKLCCLSSPSG